MIKQYYKNCKNNDDVRLFALDVMKGINNFDYVGFQVQRVEGFCGEGELYRISILYVGEKNKV